MVKCRRFIFAHHFDGLPKESDFQLVEEETPELKDGEILAESIFCSVDPYMWTFSRGLSEGVTMIGECCGKIKYREHVTEGFENMPKAFIGMLVGENTGKAVVKL
ncbi:prostaglandin reductase 1-like [Branchiostoma floridae x Branchiostoma japonicum]